MAEGESWKVKISKHGCRRWSEPAKRIRSHEEPTAFSETAKQAPKESGTAADGSFRVRSLIASNGLFTGPSKLSSCWPESGTRPYLRWLFSMLCWRPDDTRESPPEPGMKEE